MTDWVKASNPSAPITNETEARDAARASAIAILLGVLWGAFGAIYLMTAGAGLMEAAMAEAAAQNPDAAAMPGMAGMMTGFAVAMAWIMVVIQLVLAFVQWKFPNIVIPIIFIILVVYGLGSTVLSLMMMGDNPAAAMTPMWQIVVGVVIMIVQLILHIAGARGASALNKLRGA